MVGANMLGKLGLGGANVSGASTGGYQPRMFGARANPGSANESSDNSGVGNRASYAARFGATNPQSSTGSGGVAASMDYNSNKKLLTGSMTDSFGPGRDKEEQKAKSFTTPNKTAQAQLEDMDEPNLDLSTPDERP